MSDSIALDAAAVWLWKASQVENKDVATATVVHAGVVMADIAYSLRVIVDSLEELQGRFPQPRREIKR